LLQSNAVVRDESLLLECIDTIGSFATDAHCTVSLLAPSAAGCLFDHLARVGATSMRVSAALCRALLALWTSGGAAVLPLAKQLVERHVDTLALLVALGTGPDASNRIVRETAARAALLIARALPPSFEIVVAANRARSPSDDDRESHTTARAPRCNDAAAVDDDDVHRRSGADDGDEARLLAEPPERHHDVDSPCSSGAAPCECDGCLAMATGSGGGLRLAIARAGVGVRLARLALSSDPLCRSAALESLATVSRGYGDRRALRALATVSDAASARSLVALIADIVQDREQSAELRINAIVCFVNVINPLDGVDSPLRKQPLVAVLARFVRDRRLSGVGDEQLAARLLDVERLVAALVSAMHDDDEAQRAAFECQLLLPVLGDLCASVDAILARDDSALDGAVSAALGVLVRGTLLALAALCNTLEEPRRLVARDDRVLTLLRKALRDDSAAVRAAAAALARSMSRSVRALRTAMADAEISLPLVALLNDSCLKVQRIATAAVSNTLLEFSPMKRAAIDGGAVPLLAARFKSAQVDPALRLASAWALRNLLFEAPLAVKRLVINCLSLADLCRVLRGADAELREQSLGLLRNAMHAEVDAVFGLQAGEAPIASPQRARSSPRAADAASSDRLASATTITVSAEATARWSLVDCRELMATLATLLRSAAMNARAYRHALYAICNAAAGLEPLKAAVVESGVLVDVVAALEQPDVKVGEAALWCLINLTCADDRGKLQCVEQLRALGCVEKLRVLTQHDDVSVARRAGALLAALV
jgi:hypothetical protein